MQASKIGTFLATSAFAFGLCAPMANAQPQRGQGPQHEQQQQRSAPQSRDAGRQQSHQAPVRAAPKPAPAQAHKGPQQHSPEQQHARGAGPDQQWRQGGRVPQQYRGHQYVVNDWQHHGLKKPGRGQQWVQYGGDYMLVTIASGVIAQLILGR
ncbi:RcnB family protein [Diaphorobacter caeni]|uniref:RcnB family protein n=1 Tax=Diaphorobacter caeni TaxID=2784387 RepID=UPI001E5911D2|nr:RcnB family protein [Diaphorobacter caeni]